MEKIISISSILHEKPVVCFSTTTATSSFTKQGNNPHFTHFTLHLAK